MKPFALKRASRRTRTATAIVCKFLRPRYLEKG